MTPETDKNFEIVASKAAYERLRAAWSMDSPYGDQFATDLKKYFVEKMNVPITERYNWLMNDLKLNIVKKGMFQFEGPAWARTTSLLVQAAEYGNVDYIPLLRSAVLHMQGNSQEVPQDFLNDIQVVSDRMKVS